jgi:virulence factor Mce-like protein
MRNPRGQRKNVDPATSPELIVLGLLVVTLVVGVLLVSMRASSGIPGESHYDLTVQFAETGGAPVLPPRGSDVRIAGRRVGQTLASRLERGVATLELQLDGDAGRVPAGSSIEVRSQGLLGAKYVDLVPGRSTRTLPSGSTIKAARTSVATTLSDVLQALDTDRRHALGAFIRGLGGGLAGRGAALNEGLRDVSEGMDKFRAIFGPLVEDGTLPGLVRGAESASAALAPVRDDVAAMFGDVERASRPFADERASVERLLAVAPRALSQTRASLAATDPLLTRAERFADAATAFTQHAPRALRATTDLLRGGRRPLRDAQGVLRTAQSAVRPTLRLTDSLSPVLPRLRAVLDLARAPSRTLGAYGCDIARWSRTWRSFLGYAPRGQSGPLGPLAILRTTLVTGGIPGRVSSVPGASADGDISPCEPDRGLR